MVSVRIHCTEKMADFFPQQCFKQKLVDISACFFIFTQKVIHPFPAPIFPDLMMPGYPHVMKLLTLRTDSCHNFLATKIGPEL